MPSWDHKLISNLYVHDVCRPIAVRFPPIECAVLNENFAEGGLFDSISPSYPVLTWPSSGEREGHSKWHKGCVVE